MQEFFLAKRIKADQNYKKNSLLLKLTLELRREIHRVVLKLTIRSKSSEDRLRVNKISNTFVALSSLLEFVSFHKVLQLVFYHKKVISLACD